MYPDQKANECLLEKGCGVGRSWKVRLQRGTGKLLVMTDTFIVLIIVVVACRHTQSCTL
jgi:hypothetical protein